MWTMENDRYVLDANIFLEFIYGKALKDHSKKILKDTILKKYKFLFQAYYWMKSQRCFAVI